MPSQTTYSFTDLGGTIWHPEFGPPFIFTGEGVGEVSITMTQERTMHDSAADGSIMVSKIAGNNGLLTIHTQQTSILHKWLLGLYNYLVFADTDEWAEAIALLRNVSDGSSHAVFGISPQKNPDKNYQKQGQMVTWVLMAADIHSESA